MAKKRSPKRKVVKENKRKVVKWRVRKNYAPYLLLLAVLLIGIGVALYWARFVR